MTLPLANTQPRSLLRRLQRRASLGVGALTCLALVAAACGGEPAATTTSSVAPTVAVTPSSTAPTTTTSTVPTTAFSWPLTGVPTDEDPSERPVLAAKIDNTSSSRPQLGLGDADLVIEIPVEGGIPRLLAFFQSTIPDEIGPIRSSREVDPKLLAPFGAIYASSGGQGFVMSAVRNVAADASHDRLGDAAYYRASDRPSLYDLILRTGDVDEAAGEIEERPLAGLAFGDPPVAAERALTVKVSHTGLNQVEYRYSSTDGGYLRFHGDTPHETITDEEAEPSQVVAANVIVLYVRVLSTGRTDSSGSPVPDYEVVGSGDAIVFRDGVAVAGTWERATEVEFFRFLDADGDEIELASGPTWIELTANGRSAEWQ